MEFTLFRLDIGDDVISTSINAASQAWDNIDNKHPFVGALLVLSLPTIALYFIYTWGRLRIKEKELDARTRQSHYSRKRINKKGGKK